MILVNRPKGVKKQFFDILTLQQTDQRQQGAGY